MFITRATVSCIDLGKGRRGHPLRIIFGLPTIEGQFAVGATCEVVAVFIRAEVPTAFDHLG